MLKSTIYHCQSQIQSNNTTHLITTQLTANKLLSSLVIKYKHTTVSRRTEKGNSTWTTKNQSIIKFNFYPDHKHLLFLIFHLYYSFISCTSVHLLKSWKTVSNSKLRSYVHKGHWSPKIDFPLITQIFQICLWVLYSEKVRGQGLFSGSSAHKFWLLNSLMYPQNLCTTRLF